jgi:hypothetical protein
MMGSPLPSIPIQPLSYGDAFHLLRGLGGYSVPCTHSPLLLIRIHIVRHIVFIQRARFVSVSSRLRLS